MKGRFFIIILAGALAVAAGCGQAYGVIEGTIHGGPADTLIFDARIVARDSAGGVFITLSGMDGSYRLCVPQGDYHVSAEKPHYLTTGADVTVAVNPIVQDLTLTSGPAVLAWPPRSELNYDITIETAPTGYSFRSGSPSATALFTLTEPKNRAITNFGYSLDLWARMPATVPYVRGVRLYAAENPTGPFTMIAEGEFHFQPGLPALHIILDGSNLNGMHISVSLWGDTGESALSGCGEVSFLGPCTLTTPADEASLSSVNVTMSWPSVSGTDYYMVFLLQKVGMMWSSSATYQVDAPATSTTVTLTAGQEYMWYVRAETHMALFDPYFQLRSTSYGRTFTIAP